MAAKKKDAAQRELARDLAVVLLTAFSTNTWNAAHGDIVECETPEERSRLLEAQYARELDEFEPERRQRIFYIDESHAPVAVAAVPEVVPAKKKKAANDDDNDDLDGDLNKTGLLVTEEFFGADKHQLQIYRFPAGLYNVVDADGNLLNEKKLRKPAVVALINSLDDGSAD